MKVFIIGGNGSGKSSFALEIGEKISKKNKNYLKKYFIATCEPIDEELKEKIKKHRKERKGLGWQTIEEPIEISKAIKYIRKKYKNAVVIVDSITLWLTNLFVHKKSEKEIKTEIENFLEELSGFEGDIIVVSNECGLGIIPKEKSVRKWENFLSQINRRISLISDEVYFLLAGIPQKIK
jgi:adenosylcobinamide kinase/adenosylcobinamide-phosphate guanylyltransferase